MASLARPFARERLADILALDWAHTLTWTPWARGCTRRPRRPIFHAWGGCLTVPPHLRTDDETVQLLSAPQVLEDVSFTDPALPVCGTHGLTSAPQTFEVDAARLERGEAAYRRLTSADAARRSEGGAAADMTSGARALAEMRSEEFAREAARSFSGFALWPRLEVCARRHPSPVLVRLPDETAPCLATPDAALSRRPADCMRVVRGRRQLDEELVVDARGPQGAHCASCWMELLALAAPRPLPVAPGDSLSVRLSVELDARAEVPPRYFMEGEACLRDPARQAAAAAKELMQRLTKAVSKEGKE